MIPQRLPNEEVITDMGKYLRSFIDAAFQVQVGAVTVQIPSNPPDDYMRELATVLEQIYKNETPNPINYKIPYNGELRAFVSELINAIETMRQNLRQSLY